MGSSSYLKNALKAHLFRAATYAKPTELYVALFTTVPTTNGSGAVEVSTTSTGYGRQRLDPSNTNWTDSADGMVSNGVDIHFSTPLLNWGTILALGVYDAAVGGNLLVHGEMAASKVINAFDPAPVISTGELDIQW